MSEELIIVEIVWQGYIRLESIAESSSSCVSKLFLCRLEGGCYLVLWAHNPMTLVPRSYSTFTSASYDSILIALLVAH